MIKKKKSLSITTQFILMLLILQQRLFSSFSSAFSAFKHLISGVSMQQINFPRVQPTTGILFLPGCHSCSQREPLLLFRRLTASCFEVPSPVVYWVQFRKNKDHAVICSWYPHTWATSAGILEIVTPYSVYTKLQQQRIEVLSQSKHKYIQIVNAALPVPTLSDRILCCLAMEWEMRIPSNVYHSTGNTKFIQTMSYFTIFLKSWKYST